jgi:hypothetical protein
VEIFFTLIISSKSLIVLFLHKNKTWYILKQKKQKHLQKQTFMSQKSFYKIIAAPRASRNLISKILHSPKKRQILVSVLSIYTIVGSLVALTLFSRSDQNSSAYQPALVTSAIRVESDKDYGRDDIIEMKLTVQNTSATEAIKDISLDMQSTKNAVKWSKVEYKAGNTVLKSFPVDNNKSTLDLLTSGERIEYSMEGKLDQTDLQYATVIGRISFTNAEGLQSFSTNRILLKAKNILANQPEVLNLTSEQSIFLSHQKAHLMKQNTKISKVKSMSQTNKLMML